MKKQFRHCWFLFVMLLVIQAAVADETWTLKRCIQHAIANNIRIRGMHLDSLTAVSTYQQAKAGQLPNLSASVRHDVSRQSTSGVNQTTRFSLSTGWSLFQASSVRSTVSQKRNDLEIKKLAISQAETDIAMEVLQTYLQVLYARETLKNAEQSVELSKQQYERTESLVDAGSATIVNQAQMRAQYANDKYSLVVARNNVDKGIVSLKQLLDISPLQSFEPLFPEMTDSLKLGELPKKEEVLARALAAMPDIHKSKIAIETAKLELEKSRAEYIPAVSVSGGLSTSSSGGGNLGSNLENNVAPSAGVQVSVPIYDNRKKKSDVERAQIDVERAQLNLTTAEKDLLQEVETAYLNAVAARSSLAAAEERLDAARKSYEFASQKYDLGMLQPLELLVDKNAYINSQAEQLQSKFTVLLYTELLNLYQGNSVSLLE